VGQNNVYNNSHLPEVVNDLISNSPKLLSIPTKMSLSESEIINQVIGNELYRITGPSRWNSKIALGQTSASNGCVIVENTCKNEFIRIGKYCYIFVRVNYPAEESLEWWIVDLLNWSFMFDTSIEVMAKTLRGWLDSKQNPFPL